MRHPPEKLDIKFIVEPDDVETSVVLARLKLRTPFEIITAPWAGPRTKPKALNAALPFALGTFIVVYDAEDRPEPDQLQRSVEAFQTEFDNIACVQARLTIDNTADSWLASLFTAEYAAQFDLFLPGLAALKLPLPLGGSSNHFRTAVLRQIGAWDFAPSRLAYRLYTRLLPRVLDVMRRRGRRQVQKVARGDPG